ncbi:MAG TPA: hypothetical protein VNZ86_03920, partial [Bacteroidia bacterium]|nr:hypothetical protein [Bacteroidia bacterium]
MRHFPRLCLFVIVITCSWFSVTEGWYGNGGEKWKEMLSSCDAMGYYSYLPEFFIRHDLSHQDPHAVHVNTLPDGQHVNKYFIGCALCWSPVFTATVVYTKITGRPCDGYSGPFKKSLSLAALLWLCIGLGCLSGVLRILGIRPLINGLTLLLLTFGTNLFFFTSLAPSMSHLYSFSMLCCLLYFGLQFRKKGGMFYLILTVLALSLSILIRPVNILWLISLLPWLAGGWKELGQKLRNPLVILTLVLIPGFFLFLQCGAWYLQTGHWFVRTYNEEGFYFFSPEIIQVLVGFRKGWFIYTPLALLAMAGLWPWWKKDRMGSVTFLQAVLIQIYLVSAWWCWSYADSYGHRAFIDLYAIIALLLAYALEFIPALFKTKIRLIRAVLFSLCFGCLGLNLVQTYQYETGILHANSMDWERYQYVFLKTGQEYRHILGGNSDIQPYSSREPELICSIDNDFTRPFGGFTTLPAEQFRGKPALHFKGQEFGATFR